MGYLTIRAGAFIGAFILVGLWILPDYVFFPLIAAASLLASFIVLSDSVAWGIGLLLVGSGLAWYSYKIIQKHRRDELDESDKTAEEVRRRTGDFHLDRFTEES